MWGRCKFGSSVNVENVNLGRRRPFHFQNIAQNGGAGTSNSPAEGPRHQQISDSSFRFRDIALRNFL